MSLSKQIKNEEFRNWIRASLGLKYLRVGLVECISKEAKRQYDSHVNVVKQKAGIKAYNCQSCMPDIILPMHKVNKEACNQGYSNNCNCRRRNATPKRACPQGGACGIFYDLITDGHTKKSPNWQNSNFDQWTSTNGCFEFIKCFITTHGYKTKTSFAQLDALALLSICQNNRELNNIFQGTGFQNIIDTVSSVFSSFIQLSFVCTCCIHGKYYLQVTNSLCIK